MSVIDQEEVEYIDNQGETIKCNANDKIFVIDGEKTFTLDEYLSPTTLMPLWSNKNDR